MRYRIMNESNHRIRIRLYCAKITSQQEEILQYAFSAVEGVQRVVIYRATAGIALSYSGNRDTLLQKLDAFHYENVSMLAETVNTSIGMEEVRNRKLSPELKKKLRMRIMAETVADVVLPMPLQIGYHLYQMVTLRDV